MNNGRIRALNIDPVGKSLVDVSKRRSTNNCYPKFSFELFQRESGSYKKCSHHHKTKIFEVFLELSSKTWGEILKSPREKGGFEKIPLYRIKNIKKNFSPDIEELLVLRAGDDVRIFGYRVDEVFYVVCIDASPFKCYDH